MEFKDNREFNGSPIIQSLSTWEQEQSRVFCFLVFNFNHVNTQTPKCLCHFYHHFFLITLNHLGINETRREKLGAQWWYVHLCAFSFFRKRTGDSLFFSTNFCLSYLSSLYPKSNLSLFWITTIGLSITCSLFPSLFSTRALLSSTYLMPK